MGLDYFRFSSKRNLEDLNDHLRRMIIVTQMMNYKTFT